MNKIVTAALLSTLVSASASAGELLEKDTFNLAATIGSSSLSSFNGTGSKELSGFKISTGKVSHDAEGRVYMSGDYGFRMHSINTPAVIPFKLYAVAFDGSLGLALLDRLSNQNEAQWPRWIDNLAITAGLGMPVFASEKVLPGFGSNGVIYSYRYGIRYFITPTFNIALTTENISGLLIGNRVTDGTISGMEIEVAF